MEVAQPKLGQVFGNKEVINMLEGWLEIAKKGGMAYCALVGICPPKEALVDYRGAVEVEVIVPEMIDRLKEMVEKAIAARQPPEQDYDLDASYVCLNCCKQAMSFDFLVWLVGAKMEMIREGVPGPLKVGFWAGEDGKLGLRENHRMKMFLGVVKPSLALAGAEESNEALYGRTRGYRLREILDAVKRGEQIPYLKPTLRAQAMVETWFTHDEEPITITLREYDSWPHRNSNIDAWTSFAKYLQFRGETVIFVRDTAKANEPLPGFKTCPAAAIDLDVRCALYQRAKCNLFVSNGPCTLALFMDRPWLMLSQHREDSEYVCETSLWWEQNGMKAGEQYPWCKPWQKEVFSGDSFEEILTAWRGYRGALDEERRLRNDQPSGVARTA